MVPQGCARTVLIGRLGVQDDLEIVLVRFSCRLVVRDRFFCPLGLVLGSFWGVLLGSFWCFFGLLKVLESSFRRRFLVFMVSLCSLLFRPRVRRFVLVNLSTYLLVYSSTHGPSALSNPARRTARCAIK